MVALRFRIKSPLKAGFTLVELSIVLVIIGLIIGGVLVGRELINVAAIRAQISQIEKYNAAVNTFRGKYGYLPGDIPDPVASQYGFMARGQYAGEGDGNGVIEGNCCNSAGQTANPSAPTTVGLLELNGETTVFWADLGMAGLIDGGFNAATETGSFIASGITGSGINLYLPPAKIGLGNYIYVWSGGCCIIYFGPRPAGNGLNYFGLSAVSAVGAGGANADLISSANIPVASAYAIDTKIDDGLPLSGRVFAVFAGCGNDALGYAIGGSGDAQMACSGVPAAKYSSSATCFDNGNVSGTTYKYSMQVSNGAGTNCALSFQFQ